MYIVPIDGRSPHLTRPHTLAFFRNDSEKVTQPSFGEKNKQFFYMHFFYQKLRFFLIFSTANDFAKTAQKDSLDTLCIDAMSGKNHLSPLNVDF